MVFLQPWMLLASIFLAVPILLHFWRRRPVRIIFPAIQFLQQRQHATRRSLRLREILLLIARMLAVLCLVIGFARPVWGPQTAQTAVGDSAVVLVLDTSVRMDYLVEGRTRLDDAKEAARQLLARLSPSRQVAVVDCRGGPVGFEADRASALAKLGALRTAPGSMPVGAAVLRACQLTQAASVRGKDIVVFTDLAAAGWPSEIVVAIERQLSTQGAPRLWVVDVGIPHPHNWWLGDLEVVPEVAAPGQPVRLRTVVGGTGQKSVAIELYVDEPEKSATTEVKAPELAPRVSPGEARSEGTPRIVNTIDIPPEGSAAVDLGFTVKEQGAYQGVVKLAGLDGLYWDNERYFTVVVRPPQRVLIVAPAPVIENSVYIRNMLAPESLVSVGHVRFDCHLTDQSRLGDELAHGWVGIALLDPQPIEDETAKKLLGFVEKGGGLVVLLGSQAGDPVRWQSEALKRFLPAVPLRQARVPEGTYARPESYQHPIFRPLARYADKLPWELAPVFRYWQVSLPTTDSQVLMTFADGGAALLERKVGRGRVLLLTTPVSDPPRSGAWNLFTAGECWPILAMIQQIFVYATAAERETVSFWSSPRLALDVDGAGSALPRLLQRAGVRPHGPVVLEQRGEIVEIPAIDLAGNYMVEIPGHQSQSMPAFSVNVPASQTDLTRVDEGLLSKLQKAGVWVGHSVEALPAFAGGEQTGVELSGYFLLAALLFFLGELLLSNLFYRQPKMVPVLTQPQRAAEPLAGAGSAR
ncbi:MAG: BatA and WFA domain-containing protein [Thermoguttaceae bacterium]|nr:BatA and WFA domain-containing protein [Thermoguttaceae bacterium]MDW8080126.1 BatA and WFA domain-containing protein [Thermoguttaceae bacterium]